MPRCSSLVWQLLCRNGTHSLSLRILYVATGDIEKDTELTHTYISLEWRTCFSDLNKIVNGADDAKETKE